MLEDCDNSKLDLFANKEGMMEEGAITMCFIQGVFILGKLYGGNKLVDPRVFTTFMEEETDPKTGLPVLGQDGKPIQIQKIHLAPPPGQPPFVIVGEIGMKYVYPSTDNVLKLYAQVTKPPEKRIITGGNMN